MHDVATPGGRSEPDFAALVDSLAAHPDRHAQLNDLLREDHPIYDQRGATTIVRMRGWVLLALARVGVSNSALLFVLEELDAGVDPYLVAAAARALRSYSSPSAALAPFVMRAIANVRYHDEPVSFDNYGEYAVASTGTSPVRELIATLAWLGPHARSVLPEIESLRGQSGRLSRKLLLELDRATAAIRGANRVEPVDSDSCCRLPGGMGNVSSWARALRRGCQPIEDTVFEDHDARSISFSEFFHGRPSIVAFFYTRCDNPLKCSLTVTKLARIHQLLDSAGLSGQIRTAAISYDPAFDLPDRLRGYGQARGVRLDDDHRMLRATDGVAALRAHFRLGVNFIESLVNRHRIEIYVLDAGGRIAGAFERIHWDEHQVVERAVEVLKEERDPPARDVTPRDELPERVPPPPRSTAPSMFGALASLGLAFFPKCPVCWVTYLSMFGIAGLEQIPYAPWLQPVLVAVMLMNLATVGLRARSTGRTSGLYLAGAGALAILASKTRLDLQGLAVCGVALTLGGSLLSALDNESGRLVWLKRLTTRA